MNYMEACRAALANANRDDVIWRVWRRGDSDEHSIHKDGEKPAGHREVAYALPHRGVQMTP
jgi:hypothetical protein